MNTATSNELFRNEGGGSLVAITNSEISGSTYNSNYALAWGDVDGDDDLVRL